MDETLLKMVQNKTNQQIQADKENEVKDDLQAWLICGGAQCNSLHHI